MAIQLPLRECMVGLKPWTQGASADGPVLGCAGTVITTFVPPSHTALLQSASEGCLSAFTHYEGVLGEGCPLPFLQLAFLPGGVAPVGGLQLACGLLLLSEESLQDPLAVEQVSKPTSTGHLLAFMH